MAKRWFPDDELYILEHAGQVAAEDIAAHLDRTMDSLYAKVRTMKTEHPDLSLRVSPDPWTEHEILVLEDQAGSLVASEIADLLPGRSVAQVRTEARRRNLDLSVATIATFEPTDTLWTRVPEEDQLEVARILNRFAQRLETTQKGSTVVEILKWADEQLDAADDEQWDAARTYDAPEAGRDK